MTQFIFKATNHCSTKPRDRGKISLKGGDIMFDTKKFGGYLSRLRKKADMTQMELADRLNLTRQAISRYEHGDSFPDVSILVLIADIFGITLDELIDSGEPTRGEFRILEGIAGGDESVKAENIEDIVGVAPYLKPSVLTKLSAGLSAQGIDISNIISLAEYLNDDSVIFMLENAKFETISIDFLEKLMPFLETKSKYTIFQKILDGEMDWHFLRPLLVYSDGLHSLVEAAVVEGALPWEALDLMRQTWREIWERQRRNGEI